MDISIRDNGMYLVYPWTYYTDNTSMVYHIDKCDTLAPDTFSYGIKGYIIYKDIHLCLVLSRDL